MRADSRPRDGGTTPQDAVERAHLKEPDDASHVMYRYPVDPEFDGLLQRFWIPPARSSPAGR